MNLRLFEHNQKAYELAREMLRETGKAAVVHPTGTGKSFIGFRFCEDYKRVLWLAPSEYIFRTQKENLNAVLSGSPENITFMTYTKLLQISEEEVQALTPELIILDEFHRCGAEQWGRGVQKLLAAYPKVPLLGFSATHVRFLDNQRDMAEELFEGHIASEITLGEAIARGILPAPKYVLSIFCYQKDLKIYERKVSKMRNRVIRDRAEVLLEELRRKLEQADGLDAIFARHMPDPHGKYIVFCSNATHMRDMMDRVPEWFGAMDRDPHIYNVYFPDPKTLKDFDAFRADQSDHLRLLFAIDMLNEGIHVADLDGVILFRPTVSPILYKQQIGRALATGSEKAPVIFDVVNNFEGLYSVGTLDLEFEEAVQACVSVEGDGAGGEIIRERFQIIDEVRDCRILFEKLNDTLTASWDDMYLKAKKFYEEKGHLNVPSTYRTEDGYSLGTWIMTQRAVRKGLQRGILSSERIEKLDAIGMLWNVQERSDWDVCFAAAEAYAKEHGDLNVPKDYITEDGIHLGAWICRIKEKRKKDSAYLTEERVQELNRLGMVWDLRENRWEKQYKNAEAFFKEHGHLDIPVRYVAEDGSKLGVWIQRCRQAYRKGELDPERVKRLKAIGMIWDKEQQQWERMYALAKKYKEKYGDLKIPVEYRTNKVNLGAWLQRMRQNYKNGKLSKERIRLLEALGVNWEVQEMNWNTNYEAAREYARKHGDLRVPRNYMTPEGIALGNWIQNMRTANRLRTLSPERFEALDRIGMIWSLNGLKWERAYQALVRYFKEHGNLRVPKKYETEDGLQLGKWLRGVRRAYRNGTLSLDRIRKMQALDKDWDKPGGASDKKSAPEPEPKLETEQGKDTDKDPGPKPTTEQDKAQDPEPNPTPEQDKDTDPKPNSNTDSDPDPDPDSSQGGHGGNTSAV